MSARYIVTLTEVERQMLPADATAPDCAALHPGYRD